MNTEKLIGLPEEEARLLCEHYNFVLNVVEEDGQYFIQPNDYNASRINVVLNNGFVTQVGTTR